MLACLILPALAATVALPLKAQGRLRMTESEAVAALRDGQTTAERDRALGLAFELGPRAGSRLRLAIID